MKIEMKQSKRICITGSLILVSATLTFAQNQGVSAGARAIEQATSDLKSYFDPITYLIYVIAALCGLWGGFRVYTKMQSGDQDVQKTAVAWFGSCVFLLAVGGILQAFFFN